MQSLEKKPSTANACRSERTGRTCDQALALAAHAGQLVRGGKHGLRGDVRPLEVRAHLLGLDSVPDQLGEPSGIGWGDIPVSANPKVHRRKLALDGFGDLGWSARKLDSSRDGRFCLLGFLAHGRHSTFIERQTSTKVGRPPDEWANVAAWH